MIIKTQIVHGNIPETRIHTITYIITISNATVLVVPNNAFVNQTASRWFINTHRHDIKNTQLIRIKPYLKNIFKRI